MRKEIMVDVIICDYCSHEVPSRTFVKNDGSFQEDYITILNNDICLDCSLEVLSKVSKDISTETFNKIFVKKTTCESFFEAASEKLKEWKEKM